MGLKVGEGMGLPSTFASIGGGVAGDNLLLGEVGELSSLDEVSTLDSHGGGESPASTAAELVLDGKRNSTLCSPVDGGLVGLWKDRGLASNLTALSSVSEELLVLEVGPGGHVVVADGEIGLLGVDLVHLGVLLRVEAKSELVLLSGTKGESVSSDMINEGLLELQGNWLVAELFEAEVGGSFAEFLHFKERITNLN